MSPPRREYVRPLISALLEDPSPEVRSAAAEALSQQVDERELRYQSLIKAATQDKDESVQVEAVAALGLLEDKRATNVLMDKCVASAVTVRLAAIHALVHVNNPKSLPVLVGRMMQDESEDVRKEAVHILCEVGGAAVFPDVLQALEKEKIPQVREELASHLGYTRDKRGLDVLVKLTKSKDAADRKGAAAGLKWLALDDGMPAVITLLEDRDEEVRLAAIDCLGQCRSKAAVQPLLAILTNSSEKVRFAVIDALGLIADGQALPPLVDRLAKRVTTVKQTSDLQSDVKDAEASRIQSALVKYGRSNLKDLQGALSHKDPRVRLVVVQAVAASKDRRCVEFLLPLMKDPDATVGFVTMDLLFGLNDARAADAFAQMLTGGYRDRRGMALFYLTSVTSPSAVAPLLAALDHADPDDLGDILEALLASLPPGHPDAAAVERKVAPLLAAKQPLPVRALALKVLCALGNSAVLKYAVPATKDPERQVQLEACQALAKIKDKRAFAPLVELLEISGYAGGALDALKVLGDERTTAKILDRIEYLGDDVPKAAAMVASTRDPRASRAMAKWLEGYLRYPSSEEIDTLGRLGKASTPLLLKLLERKTPWLANRDAHDDVIAALAMTGDPAAIKPLLDLLEKTDPLENEYRAQRYQSIMSAAITLGHKPDAKSLLAMLADEDRQSMAAAWLGQLKEASAVDALIPLARNGNGEAITALGQIGGEKAQRVLLELAAKDDPALWPHSAVYSLASFRTPQAKALLLQLARGQTMSRFWATEVLSQWADPDTADVLAQAVLDLNQRFVGDTLLRMNSPKAIPGLVNMMTLYGRNDTDGAILVSLAKLGYKPADDRQRAYFLVASQQYDQLRSDDRFFHVLLKDAEDPNFKLSANAVVILSTVFDQKKAIPALLDTAKARPTLTLIRAFATSRSPALQQAAADWAWKNGMTFSPEGTIHRPGDAPWAHD